MSHMTYMIFGAAKSPPAFSSAAGAEYDPRFQSPVEKTGYDIFHLPGYPGIDPDATEVQLVHGLQIDAAAYQGVNAQVDHMFQFG